MPEDHNHDDIWPALEFAIDSLRGELMGEMKRVREDVARDIKGHGETVSGVEERATKADKFVRRVIRWAAGLILGSLVSAGVIIYTAGKNSETHKAEAEIERAELLHKIESVDRSLTELRGQVRLLLQSRLGDPP